MTSRTYDLILSHFGYLTEKDLDAMFENSTPKKVFIRTPYNYDTDAVSRATGLSCPEETLTSQEFAEEADINTIIKNFGVNNLPTGARIPEYGDFTQAGSYHDMCNVIAQAGESFDMLPADVRRQFNNDPGLFVDYALDPKNKEQLEKWGMIEAPLEPTPLPKALVVPNPPTALEKTESVPPSSSADSGPSGAA